MASADGKPLKEKGKATCILQIWDLKLQKELVVAEIEDEMLLGLDILIKGEKGPADIKLSEGVVLLNGFPCVQIGHSDSVRKVVSAETVIPPKSEIIVDVLVKRTDKDYLSDSQEFLIEPNQKFIEKYPVLMANCLVYIKSDVTSKVRILNLFDKEVYLIQDTVVGAAEKVESPQITLCPFENEKPEKPDSAQKKLFAGIKTATGFSDVGSIRTLTMSNSGECQKYNVPPHLENLFSEATKERPNYEKEAIAKLLCNIVMHFQQMSMT